MTKPLQNQIARHSVGRVLIGGMPSIARLNRTGSRREFGVNPALKSRGRAAPRPLPSARRMCSSRDREDGMRTTGARLLVDCLLAQGVDDGLRRARARAISRCSTRCTTSPDRVRLVPNRQEGGAGFMAAAWGKLTGAPGIAFVTRGPGATNAAIGVHTARQDSSPMILFVGQIARGDARARGVPGGRLPRRLRAARQVGDRDRRRRPHPGDRRPRLRRGALGAAGAGGRRAARGHAVRPRRRRARAGGRGCRRRRRRRRRSRRPCGCSPPPSGR